MTPTCTWVDVQNSPCTTNQYTSAQLSGLIYSHQDLVSMKEEGKMNSLMDHGHREETVPSGAAAVMADVTPRPNPLVYLSVSMYCARDLD